MKLYATLLLMASIICAILFAYFGHNTLPLIAIANYGPHASLHAVIKGLKEGLAEQGYLEGSTIRYKILDVGFDTVLIPQMLESLFMQKPQLTIAMTTPVAEIARLKTKQNPIIFSVVTDPDAIGLVYEKKTGMSMTGSSDQQDLDAFLNFAKQLIPHAKKIGLLVAVSEANDIALLKMMQQAAHNHDMELIDIHIQESRDIPQYMQTFKEKQVDFIYVGASGPIQPALPMIAAHAEEMHIPLFNSESQAVKDGLALASFGVDYKSVGYHTASIAGKFLHGIPLSDISIHYPELKDHHGIISRHQAEHFGLYVPQNLGEIVP